MGQAEEGGDQRDADEGGHGHSAGSTEAHDGQERDARHREPDEGDDDRCPGEDHRGAGGPGGPRRSRLRGKPAAELLPVAVHDEERVVDGHRKADHRGEDRRGGGERDDAAERVDRGEGDRHADDRRHQGQAGEEEGAEGDQQDEVGDEQADAVRWLLGRLRHDATPVGHDDPGTVRWAGGCGQGGTGVLGDEVRRLGEGDGGVANPAIGGDRPVEVGVRGVDDLGGGAAERRHGASGSALAEAGGRERCQHPGPDLRVGQRRPGWSLEDHLR